MSVEELAQVAAALGLAHVAPTWLGANVLVSGHAGLTSLSPSTRLVFASGAVLVVDGDNDPCLLSGAAVERGAGVAGLKSRFVQAAQGRRGLVGWVERAGADMLSMRPPASRPDWVHRPMGGRSG